MNDWWIDPGCVLACANPTDKELEDLRAKGFAVMISLLDEQQQKPRYNVVDAERAAGSVTFYRYGKARGRRWISWNASGRLFKPFLLIPRFSFTVLLVSEGRPPLARLIGLCRVRPQPKRSSPLKKPVTRIGRHRSGKLRFASSRSMGIERRNEAKKAQ